MRVFLWCTGWIVRTQAQRMWLGFVDAKKDMERMVEKVEDSDYKRYIHFLSCSNWSSTDVNKATLMATDSLLREQKKQSGFPTGLISDFKPIK